MRTLHQPRTGLRRLVSISGGHAGLFAVVALALMAFMVSNESTLAWMREASLLTFATLLVTAAGFVAFIGLFGVLSATLALAYSHWADRRAYFVLFLGLTFTAIIVANSIPIVIYIQFFDRVGLPQFWAMALPLLAANAMAYYFLHGFVSELWEESHKLYAVSARFKGSALLDFLKERAQWIVLGSLGPLFYYMLSFTLFADVILAKPWEGGGIVSVLFERLKQSGWDQQFWVYLLTMILIILPIRFSLDYMLFFWESKKGVLSGSV